VSLGIFRFLVLAPGPHHHFNDLGAGDGLVGLEAVRVIGRVNDAGVNEGLDVLLRPMSVDVGKLGVSFSDPAVSSFSSFASSAAIPRG
jgi:hypothetical protein